MLLTLLKHEVEFIIIGGYAVIYYGHNRTTGDLDIWIKPDNDNKQKLVNAFIEVGISDESVRNLSKIDITKTTVFFIGQVPYKIDFITKIQGVKWNDAVEKICLLPVEDSMVPVISYRHLIITKMMADRPQDKADVDHLQKINRYRNPPFE